MDIERARYFPDNGDTLGRRAERFKNGQKPCGYLWMKKIKRLD
jgi:hypothetical protein